MSAHVDILDEKERLRKPLLGSVALHVTLAALLLVASLLRGRGDLWGSPNAGGGAGSMTVNVVTGRIPLPARPGLVNPLANDTQSRAPAPPPTKAKPAAKAPEPDAVPIPGKKAKRVAPKREVYSKDYFRPRGDANNQLYSESGQALTSPMIGMRGGGGVGTGPSTPFGNRFGNYVAILKQKVEQSWRTGDVDPRVRTAPTVIVTFTLLRDGSVKNVRVVQRSGIALLDSSCERAIYDAAPFPPLPREYNGNDVTIEFWFDLRR